MKKFIREIIIILLQLFMFYILPMFAGPTDIMGLVLLILLSIIVLSFVIGFISNEKYKYLYPIIISILFIPTIFIYYNESALIYCVWFLVLAYVGIIIGTWIKYLIKK